MLNLMFDYMVRERRLCGIWRERNEKSETFVVIFLKGLLAQKIWKLFCDSKFIVFLLQHGSCMK